MLRGYQIAFAKADSRQRKLHPIHVNCVATHHSSRSIRGQPPTPPATMPAMTTDGAHTEPRLVLATGVSLFESNGVLSLSAVPLSKPLSGFILRKMRHDLGIRRCKRELRGCELTINSQRIWSTVENHVVSAGSVEFERILSRRYKNLGRLKIVLIALSGTMRISTATGIHNAPRRIDRTHSLTESGVVDSAFPPIVTIRICPVMMTIFTTMKNMFLWRPSKTLNLLSKRRLLGIH